MAYIWFYTFVSVFLISLVSFAGIVTLSVQKEKLEKNLIYLVSFSAGALFGDAFFHLLPEATNKVSFSLGISFSLLSGIALFFVVEKIICWRHCHLLASEEHPHPFAIVNLLGDGVHNFIDGIIIGASYLAGLPMGLATTLAVLAHEIPQEIGDFGVLLHGNFTTGQALFFNFVTALTAFFGAALALFAGTASAKVALYMLPFAAGVFIYIAGSDLIPELHKEVKLEKSLLQFFAFLGGVATMGILLKME